jgi:hypothetical protein
MSNKLERFGPGHPMFRPVAAMIAERTSNPAMRGFVKAELCKKLAEALAIDIRFSTNARWDALMTAWDEGKIPDDLVVSAFEPAWKKANEYLEGAKS